MSAKILKFPEERVVRWLIDQNPHATSDLPSCPIVKMPREVDDFLDWLFTLDKTS